MLIPLKQGLKRNRSDGKIVCGYCLNVDSIKTRIETLVKVAEYDDVYGSEC